MFRFDDEEEVGLLFEYEETTRWGKLPTREQIMANTRQLQQYRREHGMVY